MFCLTAKPARELMVVANVLAGGPQTYESRLKQIPGCQLSPASLRLLSAPSLFQVANKVQDFKPAARIQVLQLIQNLLFGHYFHRQFSPPSSH